MLWARLLAHARPRCEVLPIISRTDQDGEYESASIASKKPESELLRGTLGEIGQRRMSVEADPVWGIVAASSVATVHYHGGAQALGQRQSDLVSFAATKPRKFFAFLLASLQQLSKFLLNQLPEVRP
jgi:hypothetical protein